MKYANLPQHILRRCAGGRTDRRGSAIVLVLVSLVLMVVLAGSLLQLTRFERIPRSESNIEVVIESVIAEILNQLTDDLLDIDGHYLNTNFTLTNGGGDEPWDFPWTNAGTFGRQAERNDGSTVNVLGGSMDDTWLAAHMPDFGGAPAGTVYAGGPTNTTFGVWRKITSLTGLYLRGQDGTSNLASLGGAISEDAVTNLAVVTTSDTNIPTGSNLLVDADGDGIGDSRWEWAPLRQVGATQYVMAVRIIDLSARMDMNVSTGRFTVADTSTSRGDSPAEIDGQEFVEEAALGAGTSATIATSEWLSVLNYRMTSDAIPNATTPIISGEATRYDNNAVNPGTETRRRLWTDGSSRVSNTFNFNGENPGTTTDVFDYSNATFGTTDAFELLRGNGINSANTTPVETLMPTFLRQGGQEDNYALASPPFATQLGFWQFDPRKHVTMFSGAANAAKPAVLALDRDLRIDVNEAVRTAAGRDALRDRIRDFLSINGGALLALYPHLTTVDDLANQLTANIADYIDDDNTVTLVGDKTGFEALPYITEVYAQRPYEVTVVTPVALDGSNDLTWSPTAASATGYAIEIGNPFGRLNGGTWTGRPVSLENVWLRIGSNAAELLTSFTGMPNELEPGEVVIVHLDSTGGSDPLLDDISNLWAMPSGNATIAAEITVTDAMDDGVQTVSLHAEDQNNAGTALTWYYSGSRVESPAGDIIENAAAGTDAHAAMVGDTTYVQTNYLGVGEGIRMMTVLPQPQTISPNGYRDLVTTLARPSLNRNSMTGIAELGTVTPEFSNESKTGESPAFTSLNNQQIVWPDSDRERMHWIGDILQIPLLGPDGTATGTASSMAQAFADANLAGSIDTNSMNALYLPYQAGSPVMNATAGSGSFNYPQALLLLEQLTTFQPATDGEDGDGQTDSGTESIANPDLDEVLVPGKLNLNTAPRETLVRLLPFPDLATRQDVADAIVARRESTRQSTNFGMGADGFPGIAYTGALYQQIESLAVVNPAGDTTTLGATPARIDFNDYEDTLGNYGLADGVADDREEELMLAKWLTEVASTRSDVFAAYIVVQGYPSGNFVAGVDESARLIVLFSRAGVDGQGGQAVEIGRFRIN